MTEVRGRKYELYITQPVLRHFSATGTDTGNAGIIVNEAVQSLVVPNGYYDMSTINDNSLLITNPIQMEADIEYGDVSSAGSPQKATIKLYNLSDSTIRSIRAKQTVLLNAGYETDSTLSMLFLGSIEKVSTEHDIPNKVTTIVCTDAMAKKDMQYSRTFMLGDSYDMVLLEMSDEFTKAGIITGYILGSPKSNARMIETLSLSGNLTKLLSDVCHSIDYVWFISRGRLYIQPKDEVRVVDIFEVYPKNIIGSVSPEDDKSATSSVDPSTQVAPGVKFTVFLSPDLTLDTTVKLMQGDYEGLYKPTKITHKLNWKDGPWQTELESKSVKTLSLNQQL